MSRVIDLEEKICNIQKDLVDLDKSIREKDKEIKKWNNKKGIAADCLKLNKNNKKHLKNSQDHVVLEEYSQIIEKINEMDEEIEECNAEIGKLTKSKLKLQSECNLKNNSFKECSKELSNYCKLIQFPNANT